MQTWRERVMGSKPKRREAPIGNLSVRGPDGEEKNLLFIGIVNAEGKAVAFDRDFFKRILDLGVRPIGIYTWMLSRMDSSGFVDLNADFHTEFERIRAEDVNLDEVLAALASVDVIKTWGRPVERLLILGIGNQLRLLSAEEFGVVPS